MPGVKGLRRIQLGREVTAGTAVAATTVWRGEGTPDDEQELVYVPEDVGLAVPTDRGYIPKLGVLFPFEETPATYEQIVHVLEAGIKTVGTGAADGGGTDKIYDYALPTTAANTIKTYTIEGGDNMQAEEVEYCFVEDFVLRGEQGGALMMSANWRGRQSTLTTFTGSVAIPTVEEILFSKGKLYIDAIGGTFGATQKSNTLLGMTLNWKTGWVASPPGDWNLYFMFNKYAPTLFAAELQVTFEHDAASVAQKANWRAKTPIKLQLKFEGTQVGTPGTTYTYKSLILNLVGKWRRFQKLDEQNGNDIVTGIFDVRYDATPASAGQILVVNELTSVP